MSPKETPDGSAQQLSALMATRTNVPGAKTLDASAQQLTELFSTPTNTGGMANRRPGMPPRSASANALSELMATRTNAEQPKGPQDADAEKLRGILSKAQSQPQPQREPDQDSIRLTELMAKRTNQTRPRSESEERLAAILLKNKKGDSLPVKKPTDDWDRVNAREWDAGLDIGGIRRQTAEQPGQATPTPRFVRSLRVT